MGCLVTEPFYKAGTTLTENDAVALYELETRIDDRQIPGHYPPEDTGSTGVWSMAALMQQGRITSFRNTNRLFDVLLLLQDGPVSIGVTWYRSMFTPDAAGQIPMLPGSGIAGGHEVCLVGCSLEHQTVTVRNSWGSGWGKAGHATLRWADLSYLLTHGGDAVQPVM